MDPFPGSIAPPASTISLYVSHRLSAMPFQTAPCGKCALRRICLHATLQASRSTSQAALCSVCGVVDMFDWQTFRSLLGGFSLVVGLFSALITIYELFTQRRRRAAISAAATLIGFLIFALVLSYQGNFAVGTGDAQTATITSDANPSTLPPSQVASTFPPKATATTNSGSKSHSTYVAPTSPPAAPARPTAVPTTRPTSVPAATSTSAPVATSTPAPRATLNFCGLCSHATNEQICNSGTPAPFVASGDLTNQSSAATAQWTITLSPNGWAASPSSGVLGPNGSVSIQISSGTGLYPGQTLVATFTCNDGSGSPCPVYGWQSAGPC